MKELTVAQGAKHIVRHWLRCGMETQLLLLGDTEEREQAEALFAAARRAGAQAELIFIPQEAEQRAAVLETPDLRRAIDAAHVIVAATRHSMLTARTIAEAVAAGKRYLSLPLATKGKAMLTRPFLQMPTGWVSAMARPLLAAYGGSETLHVTTAAGTDLHFVIGGRRALAFTGDFNYSRCDSACFEVTVPPLEDSVEGVFVVDGSLGYLGLPREPLRLYFRSGRLTGIEGADAIRLRDYLDGFGDEGMTLAGELGVGLNRFARCTGECYIEDESAYGTFHIGMGRNLTFGGRHDAAGHFDLVGLAPTITLDGGMTVMREGKLLTWEELR